jgi:hypothetical protein
VVRYVGEFELSKSDNLLYYFEDGPYKDVLGFLKELTNTEPKYIRSVRGWGVPLPKLTKKALMQKLEEQDWSFEMRP